MTTKTQPKTNTDKKVDTSDTIKQETTVPEIFDASDNTLHKTFDYTMFKPLVGNRDILERKVRGIIKNIDKIGWRVNPIVVNREYEVIDGQHRLETAKRLHLPIWYIIDPSANISTAHGRNCEQTNWKLVDFIQSYSKVGNKNYECLEQLNAEFAPAVKLDVIVTACLRKATTSFHCPKILKSGAFKMEVPFTVAHDRCQFIHDNCDLPPSEKNGRGNFREFQAAVLFMMHHPYTDLNRLKKITRYILGDCNIILGSNVPQNITLLSKYYNKGLRKKIDFSHFWNKTEWNGVATA